MELDIKESDIPNLDGKNAIITGGSSGIGLAAAKILSSKGAKVYILDINRPDEDLPPGIEYQKCDISRWLDLNTAFSQIGVVHIAIANAGVSEDGSYLKDTYDEKGNLLEPNYKVIDVNLRGTFNFVKLAVNNMTRNQTSGSIVMTASATAYAPEQSLPVYSATKLALINFMRAMRSNLRDTGITINAVAPAATITKLLPRDLAAPIIAAGLPVSTAEFVGLAVVFSAVATEPQKVDVYGKDTEDWKQLPGRWNGRTILTLGDRSTEVEESYAHSRQSWFGVENLRETKMQQAATDFRAIKE